MTERYRSKKALRPREDKTLGYLEGWLSIFLNTGLFGLKLWAGLRIASVAMVADAWHTLSDSLTSVVVLLGFWLSSKPADEKHRFGHGRGEAIASVVIATLLAVVGLSFIKDSIERLVRRQSADYETVGVIIFLVAAVIKEGLALFSFWAGKRIHSRSLTADAWHHRSDALASLLIALGALVGRRLWWLDGVMGIGVSVLILYAAYESLRSAVSYLLGEAPEAHLESQIHKTVRNSDGRLNGVHHLHVHDYGKHREVTAHIQLPGRMSLEEAHAIASKVEKELKRELNLETTIHIEPAEEMGQDERDAEKADEKK